MKRRPWQIPLGVSLVLWLAMGAAFLALDYFFPSSPTDPSLVNTSTSVLLTRREWLFITAASIAVFIVLRAQSNRPKKETDDAAGDHRKHLRDVRERIEAHIVNSPLAIIEFDAEYRIVRWSPVAEQLFGWTHDEIVGRKISELRWVHEEDIAGVMQISEDMRSGLRPRNLHINRNYRKDGAIIHCEWYNSAIYDDQGKLTSVLSQVLDITERMHAEEELRRSEEKFTVMFEKAPFVAALAKMPDAKIVSVNEAFEREFGYRRDDALGKTPLELGIFPDAEATARILTDVHERRSVHDLELQLHTKSGEVRTFINNIDSVGINGENYIFATGYDITERKRAEEERRRAMQRFQIIGELIPFGTWEADSRGEATYVSKLYLDLVGQTLEEHRQRWQEMLHPDDVQPLADAWKQCVEHGALWEREFRVRGKDGAYRTILARGLPVHDEQGHVTSYVGYNFDVTERKQTEEALLRSSGRTSTILESISDAFFSLDRDWRFTYVNSQAAEQWKMKVSRLIGKKIWDVFPDGMMTEAYAKMRRAMNQHERQTFETYSKLLGHWVQTRIYPSTDGLSVYFIDITERKRAEQALRESEDRFRTMANNLPVIIWVTNAAGEIDMVNRTYEQFFGVTEQMVKPPHSWQPLVHPDDAAAYVGKYMKAADQHTTFSAEARVKRADGEWRWIESYATPRFGPAGEFLGHVGSSPDITDRKRTEEEVQRLARFPLENPNPVMRALGDGRIAYANPASARLFAEWNCIPGEYPKEPWRQLIIDAATSNTRITRRLRCEDKIYNVLFVPVSNGQEVNLYATDDTEQTRAMKLLESALMEKEMLMKELHHRVKNNMQIISSMLRLQANASENKELTRLVAESVNRIHSMSMVHELLYKSVDMTSISPDEYIDSLTQYLQRSYGSRARNVMIALEIDNSISLSLDAAVSSGLIINELVSNAFKHAFPEGRQGTIRVRLEHAHEHFFRLTVADTGKGLPTDFDVTNTKTLGMQIVRSLVKGLRGTMQVLTEGETQFVIVFSNTDHQPRMRREAAHGGELLS